MLVYGSYEGAVPRLMGGVSRPHVHTSCMALIHHIYGAALYYTHLVWKGNADNLI
jgi:hypothetical protein